jgi:hypothetical protein
VFIDRLLPDRDASEWEWLLFRQHCVVSRPQALRFLSEKVLVRHLSSGRWQTPHRGVYVTHSGPVSPHQRWWVASLAAGAGRPALLGGLSALQDLGLRRLTSKAIHILLPAARRDFDPPEDVRVHRTRNLPEKDVDTKADPPCTQAPRSVVDAAQWAVTDDEARLVIDASFQQRLVGGDQIDEVLDRLRVVRRRSLIVATVGDVRGGSETLAELDLVMLCRKEGLPVPDRQTMRTDSSGRRRYLDAFFDEWGVRVEVDGAHHMEADQWWKDMERHNALAVSNETLLRFPNWMVRERPAHVAHQIREALRSAGWRPLSTVDYLPPKTGGK